MGEQKQAPMSEQRDAFQRMFVIALCAGLVLACPYLVHSEEAEKARAWMPGDPIPFAHWLGGEHEESRMPGLAGENIKRETSSEEAEEAGVDQELMAEAQEAAEEDDEELIAPDDPPEPVAAPLKTPPAPKVPAVERPNPAAQPKAQLPPPVPTPVKKGPPPITIPAEEYEGIKQELEDPKQAMEPFYRALSRTARREKGALTRISHYGDSVIGADGLTSTTRRKLQKRFGNGGKGWVNMARSHSSYIHKDVVFRSKGWKGSFVMYGALKSGARKGRYGYGGLSVVGYGGARSSYRVYADQMELYYFDSPKGGEVKIQVDDGDWTLLSTKADVARDAWKVFKAPKRGGEHTFRVKASRGASILYGVTLERNAPGVVYDCIQMIGTRASRLLYKPFPKTVGFDPEHLKAQVEHRKPNLQVLMFGGNELGEKKMALSPYKRRYLEVIRNLRAGAPKASCLIMTPVDHGERWRGRVRTEPLLKRMVPVLRDIALESGCAFYNTLAAMGGDGAAGRWRRLKPKLMDADLSHLTKPGGRVLGTMLYKALVKGFADWLETQP